MVKSEWQKLGHNPGMIGVLVAIALIPAIYCWLYLSSMWNTYGKLDAIPVALVNHDVTQRYHGKTIQIGQHLVTSLRHSDSLDYHAVSATKAAAGLKSGRYYMIVTIPHDFSAHATTLLGAQPQQLHLTYQISSGRNFIVSKMTTGAANAIETKVSQQVTKMYAGILLKALHQVGQGMQVASVGANKLATGMTQVQAGTTKLATGQQQMGAGLTKIQTATPNLPALKPLQTGLGQLRIANTQLLMGDTQAATGLTSIQQGSRQLATKLQLSAQQLASIHQRTANATALAEPVTATIKDDAKVPNNGTGMAPFAIAIGLFVGGIAVGTMFDAYTPAKRPTHVFSWWAAKASIIGLVGAGQAGLLLVTLHQFIGLKVQSMSQLGWLLLLGSLTFLSIIFALRILLGGFGTWLVTIILVLQLSASAGLYPIQLTSSFASRLNPYLPMTYLIDGLRHAISLGGTIRTDLLVMGLVLVAMQGLIMGKFWLNIRTDKFQFLDGEDLPKAVAK
ncbi:YhgE/Pip family protein [Lactiplantibacillus daowaiensis]|uniref:YhgE/Pip family protein n=1 Tax=Lactiplantibacillus daowaiensis TaxID=2559918 RepID=A0ABW1S3W6_9LACO